MKKKKQKLIRLQVLLTPKQKKFLKTMSFKTGKSMSKVLINAYFSNSFLM